MTEKTNNFSEISTSQLVDAEYDLPFAYPDTALLYNRKDRGCGICEYPVWAHVHAESDRYYLQCGCGETQIRENFSKWKQFFTYAEQGDI